MYHLKDAKMLIKQSMQPYFITSDNSILENILDPYSPKWDNANWGNLLNLGENVLCLNSAFGGNYYHSLTWTLPRLKMIQLAGYKLEDFDKIILNFVGFKFQHDLIRILKIPKEKIIPTLPSGAIFKAKNIVVPTYPEFTVTPPIVTESIKEFIHKKKYKP